jgi:hypothetical protein
LFVANHTILTTSPGTPFTLLGFDIGGSFINTPSRWADGVEITGNLAAGGTVSFTADIPDTDPVLVPIVLPASFTGLSSVVFEPFPKPGSGPDDFDFVLDNLSVNVAAIPEPSTFALAALAGLGLVGVMWRRRAGEVARGRRGRSGGGHGRAGVG